MSRLNRRDGRFEYAWMDRVVDTMSKAGIKVIMGTPTYSIPTWMAHAHPEILARHTDVFHEIALFPITTVAADFDDAQKKFFAEGAIFDGIYSKKE